MTTCLAPKELHDFTFHDFASCEVCFLVLRKPKLVSSSFRSMIHNPHDLTVQISFSHIKTSCFMKLEDRSPPISQYLNSWYLPGQSTVQIYPSINDYDQIMISRLLSSHNSASNFSESQVSEMLISHHTSFPIDSLDDFVNYPFMSFLSSSPMSSRYPVFQYVWISTMCPSRSNGLVRFCEFTFHEFVPLLVTNILVYDFTNT